MTKEDRQMRRKHESVNQRLARQQANRLRTGSVFLDKLFGVGGRNFLNTPAVRAATAVRKFTPWGMGITAGGMLLQKGYDMYQDWQEEVPKDRFGHEYD